MLYCFLDTNIFLEFKPMTEIKWLKELSTTKVCLIITSVVVRELDEHKRGNSNRLRKRAQKALVFIENLNRESYTEISPNVTLRRDLAEPKRDTFDDNNLSPYVADDVLIAKAIEFENQNKTANVAVLSEDRAVRLKADGYNLAVPKLSRDYRLEHEPDPLVKENRELRNENFRLQNTQPKLRLGFLEADGKVVKHLHSSVHFEENLISESQLNQKIKDKQNELKYPRKRTGSKTGIFALDYDTLGVSKEQVDVYREQVREYLAGSYRSYVYQNSLFRVFRISAVKVPLYLENSGSFPAQGIEILLKIKDARVVLPGSPAQFDYPQAPMYPSPVPIMSSSLSSYMIGGRTEFNSNRVNVLGIESDLWNVEDNDVSDGYLVRCYLSKLNHNKTIDLDELYLIVDEPENASAKTSITIEFEIIAENVIDKLAKQLVVIINE